MKLLLLVLIGFHSSPQHSLKWCIINNHYLEFYNGNGARPLIILTGPCRK